VKRFANVMRSKQILFLFERLNMGKVNLHLQVVGSNDLT